MTEERTYIYLNILNNIDRGYFHIPINKLYVGIVGKISRLETRYYSDTGQVSEYFNGFVNFFHILADTEIQILMVMKWIIHQYIMKYTILKRERMLWNLLYTMQLKIIVYLHPGWISYGTIFCSQSLEFESKFLFLFDKNIKNNN